MSFVETAFVFKNVNSSACRPMSWGICVTSSGGMRTYSERSRIAPCVLMVAKLSSRIMKLWYVMLILVDVGSYLSFKHIGSRSTLSPTLLG